MRYLNLCLLALLMLGFGFTQLHAAIDHHEEAAVMQVTTDSEEAQTHFWKGFDDAENIFFTRAAKHFEQAVAADPDFAMAHFMHALVVPGLNREMRTQKLNEALAKVASASTGELLMATAMKERFLGNREVSHTLATAAAKLMPDDPHVALVLAQTADPNEGVAPLQRMTEHFPDKAPAYNILAYGLWGQGDKAGARKAVAKYLELAPDHPNAHDSYAELFQFSGFYNEAAKHYKHAIEIDESYAAAYSGLSEVHTLMGDGEKAREYLMQGMAHAATDNARAGLMRAVANTYFMAGDMKMGMEKMKAAATWAEEKELGNAASTAHRQLAVAAGMAGKTDLVEMHLDKAKGDGEASIGHHAWSALAYGMAGNAAATRAAADALKDAEANDNLVHLFDGLAHLVAGEHAEAEKALVASGLDAPMERALMARCQQEMGNKAEAKQFKQSVLSDSGFTAGDFIFAMARMSMQS